jgi:hypothetical protein
MRQGAAATGRSREFRLRFAYRSRGSTLRCAERSLVSRSIIARGFSGKIKRPGAMYRTVTRAGADSVASRSGTAAGRRFTRPAAREMPSLRPLPGARLEGRVWFPAPGAPAGYPSRLIGLAIFTAIPCPQAQLTVPGTTLGQQLASILSLRVSIGLFRGIFLAFQRPFISLPGMKEPLRTARRRSRPSCTGLRPVFQPRMRRSFHAGVCEYGNHR